MRELVIESGIKIPEVNITRRMKYPFEAMNVGDSFLVEHDIDMVDEENARKIKNLRASIMASARRFGLRFNPEFRPTFLTKVVDEGEGEERRTGVRCWRIEG